MLLQHMRTHITARSPKNPTHLLIRTLCMTEKMNRRTSTDYACTRSEPELMKTNLLTKPEETPPETEQPRELHLASNTRVTNSSLIFKLV
ncbi:hypothetical protein F2Q68_00003126 [Brassica cretica]|uniref:Uncharacterized protein n=1 Tax=Brassica cretica TaxID=69181 RepID=A0A8S9JI23_BRACR|nr:hypothetical protein F2Q68_00003126 [Brassica cretica]